MILRKLPSLAKGSRRLVSVKDAVDMATLYSLWSKIGSILADMNDIAIIGSKKRLDGTIVSLKMWKEGAQAGSVLFAAVVKGCRPHGLIQYEELRRHGDRDRSAVSFPK